MVEKEMEEMSKILDRTEDFYDQLDQKKYWKNANRIYDFLYIGDAFAARNFSLLEELQITHIINLTGTSTGSNKFKYLRIQAQDSPDYPILSHFPEVYEFIENAKKEDKKNRVLIHCMAGSNRSGSLCVAYCMSFGSMSVIEATQYVFDRRPIILTNESFRKQLIYFSGNRLSK